MLIIPSYLAAVKGFLPLQTGPVLLWVAIPQGLCGVIAVYLLKYVDARLMLAAWFGLVAVACVMNTNLSSAWAGANLTASQLVMAIGYALSFYALVGAIILEVFNTGALSRPIDVLTFAGYFQTVRLFGGELGAAFMQHFIPLREQFHSNILGLGVLRSLPQTDQRLIGLTIRLASRSCGLPSAVGRAVELLALQVRQQAFTLAITDVFTLVAWSTVCCLVVVACMARVPTQYQQIVSTSVTNA